MGRICVCVHTIFVSAHVSGSKRVGVRRTCVVKWLYLYLSVLVFKVPTQSGRFSFINRSEFDFL